MVFVKYANKISAEGYVKKNWNCLVLGLSCNGIKESRALMFLSKKKEGEGKESRRWVTIDKK